MLLDLNKSEEYFSKMAAGDSERLIDLLEIERAAMFDYLMRMTGQVNRAKETLDEAGKTIHARFSEYTDLQSLRIELYNRARQINRDVWNADIRRLENSGLNAISEGDYETSREALHLLEQSLNKLGGADREILLLRYRHGFDEQEIAKIVGASRNDVLAMLKAALGRLKTFGFAEDADFALLIGELPGHPVPERSAYSTMALSAMMSELKRSHRRPISDARWFLIAVVLGVVAVLAVLAFMGSPIFPWRK